MSWFFLIVSLHCLMTGFNDKLKILKEENIKNEKDRQNYEFIQKFYISKDEGKSWDTIKHPYGWGVPDKLYCNQSDSVFGFYESSNVLCLIRKGSDSLEYFLGETLPAINDVQQDSKSNLYINSDSGFYKYLINENTLIKKFNYKDFCLKDSVSIRINNNDDFVIYDYKLYRSKDYTLTWDTLYKSAMNGINSYMGLYSTLIDSINEFIALPNNNYMGINKKNKLIYGERDGTWWKEIYLYDFPGAIISNLRTNSNGKIFIFADRTKLISTDNYGEKFFLIDSTTFNNKQILSFYIDSLDRLFIGTDSGLYLSNNQGKKWEKINYFTDKPVYTVAQASIDTFYIGAGNELWVSYDYGNNWKLLRNYFHRSKNISSIAVNSKNEVFVGTNGGGLFKFHINEWKVLNKWLIGYYIKAIAISAKDELIVATNKELNFSNCNGDYWQMILGHYSHYPYDIFSPIDVFITKEGKIFTFNGANLYYFNNNENFYYADRINNELMVKPQWKDFDRRKTLSASYGKTLFLKFSNDGKNIYLVDEFSYFKKWNFETAELVFDLELPFDSIMAVDLSKDEQLLAIVPFKKFDSSDIALKVYIYDLKQDKSVTNFDISDGLILPSEAVNDSITKISLTFMPDSNLLLTSVGIAYKPKYINYKGRVNIWDWKLKKQVSKFNNTDEPQLVKLIGDDKIGIGTINENYKLSICDYSLKPIIEIDSFKYENFYIKLDEFVDMAYNPITEELYLSLYDYTIKCKLTNLENIIPIYLRGYNNHINFSNDYKYLFSFSSDGFRSYNIEYSDMIVDYHGLTSLDKKFIVAPDSLNIVYGGISKYQPIVLSKDLNALFSADSATIFVNNKVNFHDLSTGKPQWWVWDFGDGAVSDEQNPEHYYRKPGFYDVSLIVSDGVKIDTVKRYDYIYVRIPLIAKFDAIPKSGYAPLTVNFTDKSKGDVQRRSWNFGDDLSYWRDDTNPEHTYYYPGEYIVTLRINDYREHTVCYDTIYVIDSVNVVNDYYTENTISIFPNPAIDFVMVTLSVVEPSDVNVSISDMLGNKVYCLERESLDTGFHTKKLDVSRLDNGIYFLRISSNGMDKIFKVAVLR